MSALKLSLFNEVLARYKAGGMVILADRHDRENEGDIAVATECVTAEQINFMLQHARGLICVSIAAERAEHLGLPLQVLNNNSPFGTAFTVSVDHRSVAASGVTSSSRAATMRALIAAGAEAQDFVSPGHVFPLVADPAGVLGRQGQTEGSYDLARLAGFKPSGVICEILNTDGSMARGESLQQFAIDHDLPITTVEEVMRYRIAHEVLVRRVSSSVVTTDYGSFTAHVFIDDVDGKEHLALTYGDPALLTRPGCMVRIHSECLTGDVFGSRRCDCGAQLAYAMKEICREGSGIIVYLRQEGRGIGLLNKLKAYALQDLGHDTVEANLKLGFAADERDFRVAAKILNSLGVSQIRLLTNNPHKIATLTECGLSVQQRLPVIVDPDEYSMGYLKTKREKLGHLL